MPATYTLPLVYGAAVYADPLVIPPPPPDGSLAMGGESQSFVLPGIVPSPPSGGGDAVYVADLVYQSAVYVDVLKVEAPPAKSSFSHGGGANVTLSMAYDPSGGAGSTASIANPWAPAIREAIYSRLTQYTAVTLAVGPRIYFGALSQTCQLADGPGITYFVGDRPYGVSLVGSDGTSIVHVRISTWSYLYSDADQLAQTVRDVFDGWSGIYNRVQIMACTLKDERDFPQPPRAGTDQWVYQITQHYEVMHRVDLPTLLKG